MLCSLSTCPGGRNCRPRYRAVIAPQVTTAMHSNLLSQAFGVVPDKELLVDIVRLRVRQLGLGHRPLIAVPPGMGLSDVALSEIAEGKLSSESNSVVESPATAARAIISFPEKPAIQKKAA